MEDTVQHSSGLQKKRLSSSRILSGMLIRKKLIVIHTTFSLLLGVVLILAIRPAMSKVIRSSDLDLGGMIAHMLMLNEDLDQSNPEHFPKQTEIWIGSAQESDLNSIFLNEARDHPGEFVFLPPTKFAAGILVYKQSTSSFMVVRARSEQARQKIQLVYNLVIVALIAGYMLVAITLELFVLPEHVYRPISSILEADQAVRDGQIEFEIIPDSEIPSDELGLIMRSRNHSISSLRTHERELAGALDRLEHTAADLHRKNHLLENARKNLEGADRLASLGMMSAGIAHELNTPLAVVTGLVEKLNNQKQLSDSEITLLSRVVSRLEKLSAGLLDFARVRPPLSVQTHLKGIVDEAITLIRMDRKSVTTEFSITIENTIGDDVELFCDQDRMVQVFVNLVRNAVDALAMAKTNNGHVLISSHHEYRDESEWIMIRIEDNGPGIDIDVIDRLFEPFVSTRLDAQGTGLGLAVANGIVREHGGVLVATNRNIGHRGKGAIFEITLPIPSG